MSASPHVVLRRAQGQDSDFAYAVRKAAFREHSERIRPWDEEEERRTHDRRFRKYTYRVVQVDEEYVGVLLTSVSTDYVNVRQLFILPDRQGRGVGEACMRIVFQEARALGIPVRLRVTKGNTRALSFYRRLGFAAVVETPTHVALERTTV